MKNTSLTNTKIHKFDKSLRNEQLKYSFDESNEEKNAHAFCLKEQIQENNLRINNEIISIDKRPKRSGTKIIFRIDNIYKLLLKLLIIINIFFPVFSSYNIIMTTNFKNSSEYYKILYSFLTPDEIFLNDEQISNDGSINSYRYDFSYFL